MTGANTGAMTAEQLDKFVKGWAKKSARVIDTNLNKAPIGLISAFPIDPNLPSQMLEKWTRTHGTGKINQPLDGPGDVTRWKNVRSYKDMTLSWDKESYKINDSAQTAQAVNTMAIDGTKDVQNYFAACRAWKILTELKAKRATANTHGASSYWGSAGTGDAEVDIAKAITKIVSTTGMDIEGGNYTFGVAYPSEVLDEFKQLDLIHQIVQQLQEYLKAAWNVRLYPITPYTDGDDAAYIDLDKTTSSDVLTTSALVFVQGEQTMIGGEYRPSDILLNETSREHATGYITTLKQCVEYLAIPMDATANGKTKLCYEITGVTS